ncbi:Thermostable beta-glucosidase B [Pseudovibrio axinellae]|uniref:Thermostable beta-glucosidase B n=1 Tax=Pseudovibrio axinellae TaxID=989403 RepID=A0A165YG06_9HYPH|nr:glycoside hydrolase family 3 C-terminal domain-containing protein [Pseudovibrio axinellae]KZL18812.1 Thermostable beta-glucosidase B [Pseudovibrio axinellae]SEP91934.1 beta-glucosidase [Pseudovibrio axinellae]
MTVESAKVLEEGGATASTHSLPDDAAQPSPMQHLSDEQVASAIVSRLSQDDKLSMRDGDTAFWPGVREMMNTGSQSAPWPAGALPEHHLPGIHYTEGSRGIVHKGATTFPTAIARAATFDPELEERIGSVMGYEMRALGGTLFGGVPLNLMRHPAWGRAQESYGEDSFVIGAMGAALVRGVQQHGMACVKNFALASMEHTKLTLDVTIGQRALYEVYLPHFRKVVEAGVAAIMTSYSSINGELCGHNKELLTQLLKKDWGFDGFVLSDFIFGIRDAKKAAAAGVDLEMPFQLHFHQSLKELIGADEEIKAALDDACYRLILQQLKLLHQGTSEKTKVGSSEFRQIAQEAAEKSGVLLKNEGGILPLKNIQSIGVIGRLASVANTGDKGSSDTQPIHVITPLAGLRSCYKHKVDIWHDRGQNIIRALQIAKRADAVVLVVGYDHSCEGERVATDLAAQFHKMLPQPRSREEAQIASQFLRAFGGSGSTGRSQSSEKAEEGYGAGDRDSLRLPPHDVELIEQVCAVNPNCVVVVMGGGTILMNEWQDKPAAILLHWYPGMEGGRALARLLSGEVAPSGKLPFVIPRHESDLPDFDRKARKVIYDLWHGYRKLERDGVTPAYPFGFGLSYTQFHYSELVVTPPEELISGRIQVEFSVTNIGKVDADEVAQVYIAPKGSSAERAKQELKGFQRISLSTGESRRTSIYIPIEELAIYDGERNQMVVERINYDVIVGGSSQDPNSLSSELDLFGEPPKSTEKPA